MSYTLRGYLLALASTRKQTKETLKLKTSWLVECWKFVKKHKRLRIVAIVMVASSSNSSSGGSGKGGIKAR